jgi:hypothetical protein
MIDWWGVFSNALWVLGLSVLLAAWSMAYYEAQRTGQKTLELLGTRGYSWVVMVGLVLFCAGLAATEDRLWAQILWGLLGVAFIVDQLLRWRNDRHSTSDKEAET